MESAHRALIMATAVSAATLLLTLIWDWNGYLFAFVFLQQTTEQAITVWLGTFITSKTWIGRR
jgi:ABC-type glycerol-3-phosphate transport system permease component